MTQQNRLSTAILLIVFNRPDKTRTLVDFFKSYRGLDIFVAADGARHDGERERCEAVRAIVQELGADHNLHLRFAERNLGCGTNVSSAIRWVLDAREDVIIIEDDVQVTDAFLRTCATMLDRYRNDTSIACICGGPLINLPQDQYPVAFLSRYPNIWGWATWRRAYAPYSLTLDGFDVARIWRVLSTTFTTFTTRAYWLMLILLVRSRRIDTWDFQYYFMTWAHGMRALVPRDNLTQNIGFDADATHVKTAPDNVGVLDSDVAAATAALSDPTFAPTPNAHYDAVIDRDLYKIDLLKVVKFMVKYVITKPKPYIP